MWEMSSVCAAGSIILKKLDNITIKKSFKQKQVCVYGDIWQMRNRAIQPIYSIDRPKRVMPYVAAYARTYFHFSYTFFPKFGKNAPKQTCTESIRTRRTKDAINLFPPLNHAEGNPDEERHVRNTPEGIIPAAGGEAIPVALCGWINFSRYLFRDSWRIWISWRIDFCGETSRAERCK